jgi:type II secretory pathway pseudopilin PulG
MMVAVTIVGIAVALSMPRVQAISNQNKVQRAAQALQQETQQAFAIAGRNRAPVTLRWSAASLQLQTTNLAGTTVYRRLGLGTGGGYGLDTSQVHMTPTTLTVFPNGLAADTLLITLARRGYSRTIRMSRSGMVRIR